MLSQIAGRGLLYDLLDRNLWATGGRQEHRPRDNLGAHQDPWLDDVRVAARSENRHLHQPKCEAEIDPLLQEADQTLGIGPDPVTHDQQQHLASPQGALHPNNQVFRPIRVDIRSQDRVQDRIARFTRSQPDSVPKAIVVQPAQRRSVVQELC